MGHKGSEKGSDSEDSRGWMQAKNRRNNKSSSKISPGDKLPKKNNRNRLEGGKVKNDYRRNQNNDRISSGGGGLEKDGRRSKNYYETIPEEDEETLREPVGQMFLKKAQSNTPPPSKSRNKSDVERVGKADKVTVEKLPKNPNHTNSNESLVRMAEMTVVHHCNCEGCIKKICEIIKNAEGYHGMSIDTERNAVTVKGTMDMIKALANRVSNSKRLKNMTVLIAPLDDYGGGLQADAESPSPGKDMVGAASKTGKGTEPQKDLDGNKSNKDMVVRGGDGATKAAGKELDGNKSNKPPVTKAELKMAVPCSGCGGHLRQIRKIVENTKGFHSGKVSSDEMGKAVVSGTGTMDVINALKEELEKFNTSVEVSPSPPVLGDLDHGGSENKRGRKQRKSAADGGGGQAKENLMHYDPTEYPNPSIYSYDGDYSFQLLRGLCPF